MTFAGRIPEGSVFGIFYAAGILLFLVVAGGDVFFETRWKFYDDFDELPIIWIVPMLGFFVGVLVWLLARRRQFPVNLSGFILAGVQAGAISTAAAFALSLIAIGGVAVVTNSLKWGFDFELVGSVAGVVALGSLMAAWYVLLPAVPFGIAGGVAGATAVYLIRAVKSRAS